MDNRFGMNNGHQHKNNHQNGFGNDYQQRSSPPTLRQVDDEINDDRDEQPIPDSVREHEVASPSTQV